jgi:N-acetylglucosaminyl-diphospho-decaprenol L-rhamnosyltransferase
MALVDVVVVSYNSADHLRPCVEGLSREPDVSVTVVDNASADGTLETVADLPVHSIQTGANLGFARGCNIGWAGGSSPYVLFLNPDAQLARSSLDALVATLESTPRAGVAAPRIVSETGELQWSLRRFPRLRSTYAQALFLHLVARHAAWADEVIRDRDWYERAGVQEWASGACLLVRRSLLEQLGGFDERFFIYCEDIDLCYRTRSAGYEVHYVPDAVAVHAGGASAPREAMTATLTRSRITWARSHRSRLGAAAEQLGIGLEAATRLAVGHGGRLGRRGHAQSLRAALRVI